MDWVIRVEETRVGVTDDREFVLILKHMRARGSDADWHGTITRTDGGVAVHRDNASDVDTLTLRLKQWVAEQGAIRERDPFTTNERDPSPDGT